MKITEIEHTPNPNAMKFVLSEPITQGFAARSFASVEDAQGVPLARRLFEVEHVISVYFADRWITVTQDGRADWTELTRAVAVPIREASREDANPDLALAATSAGEGDSDGPGLDDDRIPAIREVIDYHIMPFLAGDGGGLQILALVENELLIRYEGACGTCPSSMSGTLLAIENLIQAEVDADLVVRAV